MEPALSALRDAREALPGCLAIGIADVASGWLRHACCDHPDEARPLDLAAAAAGALLHGAHAVGWQPAANGETEGGAEALILGDDRIHLLVELPSAPGSALIAICAPSRNLGLLLTRARRLAAEIAS
jgi:hypothetical protein